MPNVSVIIPAYNQAQYLGKAIESVLAQTFADFELIIVNDGSTDHTDQVAQSFDDPRIQYICQVNKGLSSARNTGIAHAEAPYLTFLDSDDHFLPTKLDLLIAVLQRNSGIGLAAGQAIIMNSAGQDLRNRVEIPIPEDLSHLTLGNPLHVGSVLLRREWLDQVELFDENLRACEDWDMWLRLALAGCQMRSISQPVSRYRVHEDQMTRSAVRMRTAMLTTLDKLYARSDLPADWVAIRERAYAAAYVKAAARAYHAGEYSDARSDLVTAVNLYPDFLHQNGHHIATTLAGWAYAPVNDDPLGYLERVYANLPNALEPLYRQRRHYLSQTALNLAFESFERRELSHARKFLRRALRYQPTHIRNRGVLSVLARSYLPI